MKNKLWIKILYVLTAIIQVGLVIGVSVIEYLSDKKAGVMHHVYYRRYQFENSIFSQSNIDTQKLIVMALIGVFLVVAILVVKNRKNTFVRVQSILAFVLSILLYVIMSSSYFVDLLAYHYFIMIFALILAIQIIVLIATLIVDKINK